MDTRKVNSYAIPLQSDALNFDAVAVAGQACPCLLTRSGAVPWGFYEEICNYCPLKLLL
jgi:hypothetical protein